MFQFQSGCPWPPDSLWGIERKHPDLCGPTEYGSSIRCWCDISRIKSLQIHWVCTNRSWKDLYTLTIFFPIARLIDNPSASFSTSKAISAYCMMTIGIGFMWLTPRFDGHGMRIELETIHEKVYKAQLIHPFLGPVCYLWFAIYCTVIQPGWGQLFGLLLAPSPTISKLCRQNQTDPTYLRIRSSRSEPIWLATASLR